MIKRIIKKSGIGKILLFAILVLAMATAAEPVLRPSSVRSCTNAVSAFRKLPENSIDVIAFGSSRVWRGINTPILCDEFGFSAYNFGTNWQKLNTTELYVEEALKTQSPKVALVEVRNVARLTRNKAFCGELYATRALPWTHRKLSYLHWALKLEPAEILSYLFPVFSTHSSWTDLFFPPRELVGVPQLLADRGSFIDERAKNVTPVTFGNHSVQRELGKGSRTALDRIVKLFKQKGTDVIFYLTPCTGRFYHSEALEEYAREMGCTYLDGFKYLEEIGLDPQTDFSDKSHLNESGSRKMTCFLGNYIREHYDLS